MRLSDKAEAKIEEIKARYPNQRSAVMAALYIAQEELGYISQDAILWVSERLELRQCMCRKSLLFTLCIIKSRSGNIIFSFVETSRALRGMKDLTQSVHERLKIKPGEVTSDGVFSYEEVECLGSWWYCPNVPD